MRPRAAKLGPRIIRLTAVTTMKLGLFAIGLLATALFVGFGAGWAVLFIVNGILPPFRPEDDDTLREFVPVALTYLTWGVTTTVVLVLGWRRRPGRNGSSRRAVPASSGSPPDLG